MSHWSGSKNWKQGENCCRWGKSAGWKNNLNSQWIQDWTTSLFAHSAKCQNSFRNFSETVKDRSGERDTWTNDWAPLWEQGCGCTSVFKNLSGHIHEPNMKWFHQTVIFQRNNYQWSTKPFTLYKGTISIRNRLHEVVRRGAYHFKKTSNLLVQLSETNTTSCL